VIAEILNPKDPRVWQACVALCARTKHPTRHVWSLFEELSSLQKGAVIGVSSGDVLVAVFGVEARGEDAALIRFAYIEKGADTREVVDSVLSLLRKLGFRRWYAYVWGDRKRGEAAARLFRAKVINTQTLIEGEV